MTMQFIFSEQKANAMGYSLEACYAVLDRLFAPYSVFKVSEGVYTGDASQSAFTAFAVAHKLPYTDWFLKVIDVWRAYEDVEHPDTFEDCLALYA